MVDSIVYGPVPSRRLGRSLGINNISFKTCSYSCVYCQLGSTTNLQVERRSFYQPEEIVQSVKSKLEQIRRKNEQLDYLAFVPDGEPTLDAKLGTEIKLMKSLGIKLAVISNSSLIWRHDVRQDLQKADWVSLKVDAVNRYIWHKINRPQKSLNLELILDGMLEFAAGFKGTLATESMLIKGIGDTEEELERLADFLGELKPDKAYLAIPTRPPAKRCINPASEQIVNMAYQIFSKKLRSVEYLIGYEGNDFVSTGKPVDDLLSITSVHPMREEAVAEFLKHTDTGWEVVVKLVEDGELVTAEHQGHKFYVRKLLGRK